MYTKGWGLLVDWKCFLEAAFTWQTLRGLRLSRKRHAAELQSGHARVNLASLPQEVMNTIEAYVMASTPKRVRSRAPFKFKSDCCQKAMEAFRDSDELWDAYEEFRDSEDRDVSGYRFVKGFSKYLWQDFEISSEWEELETEWMADHRRSDCFIATSQHNFWTRFTTKEKQGRIRNHIRQLVSPKSHILQVST